MSAHEKYGPIKYKQVQCPECNGKGWINCVGEDICDWCGGSGRDKKSYCNSGYCKKCYGSGKISTTRCNCASCGGSGYITIQDFD